MNTTYTTYQIVYRWEILDSNGNQIDLEHIEIMSSSSKQSIYNCIQALKDGKKRKFSCPVYPQVSIDEYNDGFWRYYVYEYDGNPNDNNTDHTITNAEEWLDDNFALMPKSIKLGDRVTVGETGMPHHMKQHVCLVEKIAPFSKGCYVVIVAIGKRGKPLKASNKTHHLPLSLSHKLNKI